MSNIRRYYIANSCVFVTAVTYKREKFFENSENRFNLLTTIEDVMKEESASLMAYTLLPDHFHLLIQLNDDNFNYSRILQLIKGRFSYKYKKNLIQGHNQIWQRRFWDHIIRDEKDFKNHLDYVHWNAVKHGWADEPLKWRDSSYRQWLDTGVYSDVWGVGLEPDHIKNMNLE